MGPLMIIAIGALLGAGRGGCQGLEVLYETNGEIVISFVAYTVAGGIKGAILGGIAAAVLSLGAAVLSLGGAFF